MLETNTTSGKHTPCPVQAVFWLQSNLLAQAVSEMRVVILERQLNEHRPYVQSRAEDRNETDLTLKNL